MRLFQTLCLLLISNTIFAWDNHAMLTKPVLKYLSANDKFMSNYLDQSVKTESLKSFLEATKKSLPAKLQEIENWARQNEKGYQSLPVALFYQPEQTDCANNLETCFKKTLRINLDVPTGFIVYDPFHEYAGLKENSVIKKAGEILPLYIQPDFALSDFTKVRENSLIKISDIIATASMQPDFGFDTYLYENSNTAFGKIYGFGKQPLGDTTISSHSQMMFHMSTYYDSPKLLFFMPELNHVYPEYRAYLYMQLSKFAAENHHPYWAAVFMGWGLHYIQDLTQPYHTQLTYGLDITDVLQAFLELAKKNHAPFADLQTVQANRHILLESLARHIADSYTDNGKYKQLLYTALEATQEQPSCDLQTQFLRNQMNQNIVDFHTILRTTLPADYVNSASFNAHDFTNYNALMKDMNASQRLTLTLGIAKALRQYSSYTKACIKYYGKQA